MVAYTESATYIGHVNRLTADISVLETELNEIKAFLKLQKRGAPDLGPKRKRRDQLMARLKTKYGRLARVQRLDLPPWDLVHILMDIDGTLWTAAEQETWHKELANHEGRGEKALRMRHGLDIKVVQGDCDLPEINEEAKNLQGRRGDGKFALQVIQTGRTGRHAYSSWMGLNAEAGTFKELPPEVRTSLFTGEVSSGTVFKRLPDVVRESLYAVVRPSAILGHYAAVNGTTRNGFLRIPQADYDKAWRFECITKCGPKYALKVEYVKARLLASAAQHGPDVAA